MTPHHGHVATPPTSYATVGRISVVNEADAKILRLVGEIDDAAIVAFEGTSARADAPTSPGSVIDVVDLAEVTYFSSSGVSFLLRHTKEARAQGRRPTLRGLANPARRILHLTGVAELFDTAA